MASPTPSGVVPAQLGFLAIYNPALGGGGRSESDESVEDQIAYWYSASAPPGHGGSGAPWSSAAAAGSHKLRRRGAAAVSEAEQAAQRALEHERRNERLRQVGLAQATVAFARGFAGGQAVDCVDTERTRVVIGRLEGPAPGTGVGEDNGWWVLASVDLAKIPPAPGSGGGSGGSSGAAAGKGKGTGKSEGAVATRGEPDGVEYSAREVKPAALLLAELERAHRLFLLHHGASLSALWARWGQRARFTSALARYWDVFLASWSVSLSGGSPAAGVWGGIRMAACGELGVGVGEEERGSGEREVLEGFVGRIDGLIDVVVSRFGDAGGTGGSGGDEDGDAVGSRNASPVRRRGGSGITTQSQQQQQQQQQQWLGTGEELGAEDGAIFLGVGALSRPSLRDVANWMEDLYTWGEKAYGVLENPSPTARERAKAARQKARAERAERRKRASGGGAGKLVKRRGAERREGKGKGKTEAGGAAVVATASTASPGPASPGPAAPAPPDLDPPMMVPPSLIQPAKPAQPPTAGSPAAHKPSVSSASAPHDDTDTAQKLVSFLKLGYGTYWTLPGTGPVHDGAPSAPSPAGKHDAAEATASRTASFSADGDLAGRYLVGLVGELDEATGFSDLDESEREEAADDSVAAASLKGTTTPEDGDAATARRVSTTNAAAFAKLPSPKERATVLARTLAVELAEPLGDEEEDVDDGDEARAEGEDSAAPLFGSDESAASDSDDGSDSAAEDAHKSAGRRRKTAVRLRVVVFVCRPFIFTLLFRRPRRRKAAVVAAGHARTGSGGRHSRSRSSGSHSTQSTHNTSLSGAALYRSLALQLAPLRRPLLASTAYRPDASAVEGVKTQGGRHATAQQQASIYDLVWDPRAMTVHSTIPNIPQPSALGGGAGANPNLSTSTTTSPWTRAEALSTHAHLLGIFAATRPRPPVVDGFRFDGGADDPGAELERTLKTARGWWVVWSRVVDNLGGGGDSSERKQVAGGYGYGSHAGGGGPSATGGAVGPLLETVAEEDDYGSDDDDYFAQLAGAMENMHVGEAVEEDSSLSPATPRRSGSQKSLVPDDNDDDEGTVTLGPEPPGPNPLQTRISKEIFLIRRAGDNPGNALSTSGGGASSSSSANRALGAGGPAAYLPSWVGLGAGGGSPGPMAGSEILPPAAAASWTEGATRLAQGIGVDTKKYVEALLSLNR